MGEPFLRGEGFRPLLLKPGAFWVRPYEYSSGVSNLKWGKEFDPVTLS
jgi:hypothetical protein